MSNTILIDGSNLFTIHFTANPSTDNSGQPVGGVVGTLNALCRIQRTLKASKIIFFFDGKGGSAGRRKLFGEYKQGRRPPSVAGRFYNFGTEERAEKNRDYQFSLLREIIDFLPINLIVSNDFEADDAIAYCVKHKNFFDLKTIYITSCDRDFFQLISNDVSIYNPMSKKVIDANDVIAEYGIHPNNWLLYRSITGDKSDNIDGVRGFGPKTILKCLNLESAEDKFTFDDIEFLATNSMPIKEKILAKIVKLYENKDKILRNWELMDLSNPILSSTAKDILTKNIQSYKPEFKKIDLYKSFNKFGLALDPLKFDDFRFLMK